MANALNTPSAEARSVYDWFRRAQVDYNELYIRMYIAYNAWYGQVTGSANDRQALNALKKRYVIWQDYQQGSALRTLRPYMERLVEYTTREPFGSQTPYWTGIVRDVDDWHGLIEYWYQVRCRLVHGTEVKHTHIWLAYETLGLFMREIIERMQSCFSQHDRTRLEVASQLATTEHAVEGAIRQLQHELYQEYITAPDVWQVDMLPRTLTPVPPGVR